MSTDHEVPDAVALTLDLLIDQPDWSKIREAAKAANVFPDTLAAIDKIEEAWENPNAPFLNMLNVRDGKTLVVAGSDDPTSTLLRVMIDRLKRLEVLEAGGFDGKMASGTNDRLFAMWFTPDVIREEITEATEYDLADFDPKAIEDAIRHVVCHDDGDWTFEHVCQVRTRIVELALDYTKNPEPALATTGGKS